MNDKEEEYLADKKYIHKTLEHTVLYVEKLNDKFEVFKLETSNKLAVIQTKLALYVGVGSVVISAGVTFLLQHLGVSK